MTGVDALRTGRSAWPGIVVDEGAFMAVVEAALYAPSSEESPTEIKLHVEDLYLAFAALQGDAIALAELDRICARLVDDALRVVGPNRMASDEARQLIRELLFVGGKLRKYGGRGRLKNWLRVLILRLVVRRHNVREREMPFDDGVLARLLGGGSDVELAYMKELYREEFQRAFEQALAALGDQERTLLRLAFLEGLTIDDLARLHNVHRATAARWITKAENVVYESVRERLKAKLGIDSAELDSILRLVRSGLEIAFEGYLSDRS